MSIRKTTVKGKTVYAAKDVYDAIGVRWHGIDTLPYTVPFNEATFKTAKGKRVKMFALTSKDLQAVEKEFGKKIQKTWLNPTVNNTQVQKLEKTVKNLKTVVAQLLTKGTVNTKTLQSKGKSASLKKNDLLQAEARKQVRELVQDYASNRADELGITESDSRSIFYDLSFKALYNAYKLSTPNKLDLKAEADRYTETSGKKTSGLMMAEKLGVAIELLEFAKALYNL